MTVVLLLFAALGVAPLMLGLALIVRKPERPVRPPVLGSILFCALAFNLVFFWQELWLVIPKALTPGLHPTLFHNNHDWTGSAPTVELLQGTGALATFTIGLIFTALLTAGPRLGATARLFCFWMAFQGLNQALTQVAVGAVLPGNDIGRALAYLGVGRSGHIALGLVTIAALAGSGIVLATLFPAEIPGERTQPSTSVLVVLTSAMLSIAVIVPFRIPRDPIETTLIPLIVNGIGAGWTTLGFALARTKAGSDDPARAQATLPAIGLIALFLFFQLILRPGIRF